VFGFLYFIIADGVKTMTDNN